MGTEEQRLKRWNKWFVIAVVVIIISFTTYGIYAGRNVPRQKIGMFEMLNDPGVILITGQENTYSNAYYSYGAIYYNLTFVGGWMSFGISTSDLAIVKRLHHFETYVGCDQFQIDLDVLKVKSVITSEKYNEYLQSCGLEYIDRKGNIYLYENIGGYNELTIL